MDGWIDRSDHDRLTMIYYIVISISHQWKGQRVRNMSAQQLEAFTVSYYDGYGTAELPGLKVG